MRSDNLIQQKSYNFALNIIKLAQKLKEATHFEISSQVLRSGTSIGANVEEAIGGQSRKDFYAKLSIAYKEARESHYWLRLIKDSGLYNGDEINNRIEECEEILKIITAILNKIKQNGF
ncbi:four helix bundle protein [Marivirga arenosa]|uniref:Four helix bundle protein n=1 Tax=Marivirga arenosa TaxID=3059076 RepID=A0AA49GCV6_9BACT|nr:four helix bundle protein [Marivirga sp. BKB1-2]WKK82071.1 four helix bundle protein [Marivirga sp. BKB1-2]